MVSDKPAINIVVADDDEDDRMLTLDALEECEVGDAVRMVEDGEQLMSLLRKQGPYAEDQHLPPGLILLDLNMPRKDGREALADIKSDPALRRIPVVVFTTSRDEEDVFRSYDLGVSSFIVKPANFETLVDILKTLVRYWFEIVEPAPEKEERLT